MTIPLLAVLAALIKCVFIFSVVMGLASFFSIWVERKQSAMMQDRIGANRADILGFRALGLFHIISDSIKMLTKEDFLPPFADKVLFWLAPLIAACAAMIGFAVIPFGPTVSAFGTEIPLVVMESEIGMLVLLGALGLTVYGSFLAGIAANNKYALLGGLRAGAQMAAYEVAIGLSLVGVFMVFGTLDLHSIVEAQQQPLCSGGMPGAGLLPRWGIVVQPLAFVLFLTAAVAETKRAPFDIPEGESEIIGYFLEYSGMKFGLFLMSEFIETVLFSAVIALLFFGGWHLPGLDLSSLPAGLAVLAGSAVFWGKVVCGCWLLLLIRWTLPRFRYDQLLDLGWKYLLPAALLNILLTGGALIWLGSGS